MVSSVNTAVADFNILQTSQLSLIWRNMYSLEVKQFRRKTRSSQRSPASNQNSLANKMFLIFLVFYLHLIKVFKLSYQLDVIYTNLTAYIVITTFITWGAGELNKWCNNNVYLKLVCYVTFQWHNKNNIRWKIRWKVAVILMVDIMLNFRLDGKDSSQITHRLILGTHTWVFVYFPSQVSCWSSQGNLFRPIVDWERLKTW